MIIARQNDTEMRSSYILDAVVCRRRSLEVGDTAESFVDQVEMKRVCAAKQALVFIHPSPLTAQYVRVQHSTARQVAEDMY
jgi:hypothetical protein